MAHLYFNKQGNWLFSRQEKAKENQYIIKEVEDLSVTKHLKSVDLKTDEFIYDQEKIAKDEAKEVKKLEKKALIISAKSKLKTYGLTEAEIDAIIDKE